MPFLTVTLKLLEGFGATVLIFVITLLADAGGAWPSSSHRGHHGNLT